MNSLHSMKQVSLFVVTTKTTPQCRDQFIVCLTMVVNITCASVCALNSKRNSQ